MIVLLLAFVVVAILVYKLWKPVLRAPKAEVKPNQANLYFFYTNWCGFSQKAMPEWEELETRLKETPVFGSTKVTPIRVNAEEDRKTALLYEIDAYPMIKLETSSMLTEFSGPRTADGLVKFLRETLGKERKSL